MKSNLRALNLLVYHAELPISLYGEDSPPADGQTRKFNREEKPIEDSRDNKVEIYDLLKKQFTSGIWKVNPYLRFRYLSSFYNVHT